MENDAVSRVPELVEKLIKHHLPPGKAGQYQNYFLRLLSSRLNASTRDEGAIRDLIQRRLKPKAAEHFLGLFSRFQRNRAITKKAAVLHLLSKIQEVPSASIPGAPLELVAPRPAPVPEPLVTEALPTKPASLSPLDIDLLRDVLFTFQGVEGKYVSFSTLEDAYTIEPKISVSPSVKKMVYELSELGWLYRKITNFIAYNIDQLSLASQGLCFSLQNELTEYYRLVALLEQQIAQAENLNLRKLYLWCQEPLERMRWLAIIADSVEGLKGGALISAIHSYCRIGNSSVRTLVTRILDEVSECLLQMIKSWMLEGELNDPHQEFFVAVNQAVTDDRLWHEKYKLNAAMVPAFFDESLANTILLTGKSLNFLRKCCSEEEWAAEAPLALPRIHELAELKRWVSSAAEVTNAQVMRVLFSKYRFKEHCNSIKKYLLLAQGDFHHSLMELLVTPLNERARKIYKHNIVSMLESAIRASNARFDDLEFLNRIDVKLLEASENEVGWDVFTLEYILSSPLSTIITEEAMICYIRLFKFLWQIKRVHFYINSFQDTRTLLTLETMQDVRRHLHSCQLVRYEILHFINNITNYLMFEVIEGSWNEFMLSLEKVRDLDELIRTHQQYVEALIKKAFLSHETEKLHQQLLKLVDLASRFSKDQETLINSAKDEFGRRKRLQSQQEHLRDDETNAFPQISSESIYDIKEIADKFLEGVQKFRDELAGTDKTHLKALSFRLDFNEYYTRYENMKAVELDPSIIHRDIGDPRSW